MSPGGANDGGPIYEDIDQYHHHPPMIAPVSGVPNLKVRDQFKEMPFNDTLSISFDAHTHDIRK